MAHKEIDYSEILDVEAFQKECDAVFAGSGKPLLDARSQLLPIFRKASNDGRKTARQILMRTVGDWIVHAVYPGCRTV